MYCNAVKEKSLKASMQTGFGAKFGPVQLLKTEVTPKLLLVSVSVPVIVCILGLESWEFLCIVISCEIPRRYRDLVAEFHCPFTGSAPFFSSSESARKLTTSVSPFLLLYDLVRRKYHHFSDKMEMEYRLF